MTWQRLKLWYAVLAGIPAWTVHLLTVSVSFVHPQGLDEPRKRAE